MTHRNQAFRRHLDELFACRRCRGVESAPVTGAVEGAKVMLVGQAPGPREVVDRRPFAWTAGRRLFTWFERLGLHEARFREQVHICAVIRCFPGRDPKSGGDRVPSQEEITNCSGYLDREIELLKPHLVVAVGTLAARQFLAESALARVVGTKHRVSRAGHRFDLVVLPHPSGRSTWLNRPENALLFERSLEAILQHPAFTRLVGADRDVSRDSK